jgi:hypothetical protein
MAAWPSVGSAAPTVTVSYASDGNNAHLVATVTDGDPVGTPPITDDHLTFPGQVVGVMGPAGWQCDPGPGLHEAVCGGGSSLSPGASALINIQFAAPVPADSGGTADFRRMDNSLLSGVPITGPVLPFDLAATWRQVGLLEFFVNGAEAHLALDVTNVGGAASPALSPGALVSAAPGTSQGIFEFGLSSQGCSFVGEGLVQCDLPSLPPGGHHEILVSSTAGEKLVNGTAVGTTDTVDVSARVNGGLNCSGEVTCANNVAELRLDFAEPRATFDAIINGGFYGEETPSGKQVDESRPRAVVAASGSAVRSVQVAALSIGRGAKPATASCTWLSNTHGQLVKKAPLNGTCSDAVWIKAKITRAHRGKPLQWSLKLAKPMPKGRYIIYVRATDASGISTFRFSAQRHNMRTITAAYCVTHGLCKGP